MLNITFVILEIVYGLTSNSSALLADAVHNASYLLGLVFDWTAAWMATIKPKGKSTFGLRKNNYSCFHSQYIIAFRGNCNYYVECTCYGYKNYNCCHNRNGTVDFTI
ncbi:MAG: cation transporter [Bacteroidales bacterium]